MNRKIRPAAAASAGRISCKLFPESPFIAAAAEKKQLLLFNSCGDRSAYRPLAADFIVILTEIPKGIPHIVLIFANFVSCLKCKNVALYLHHFSVVLF